VFAVFMGLRGAVHAIGFTVPWGLEGPKGVDYSTTLLAGSIDVGDAGVRLLGLVWLATGAALLGVAALLWRRHALAMPAAVGLLAVSLVLCVLGLPGSVYGLIIDIVLLGLLASVPERLVWLLVSDR
jgi:hypothetical protein